MNKPIAIVTGANRGLGFEIAKQLANEHFQVWMLGRNEQQIKQSATQLKEQGLDVVAIKVDVSSEQDIKLLKEQIKSTDAQVQCLINNAGVVLDTPDGSWDPTPNALLVPTEAIAKTLDINTLGPLRMIQAVTPYMIKNKTGRIVNVSSSAGGLTHPESGAVAYGLSKTALNAITVRVAQELKPYGILVNSVCPGWVQTDMGGESATRTVEQGAKSVIWAALLPKDGPTGGFYRDGEPLAW